jgi:predicted ribosomally synthesized peptide with SipW-like signal peptide
MSDQPIELTRRKALAALGTVGVASAGAGLGTTAFFSDTEEFANNSLRAGSLDLKVDFEEHYADWINNRNGDGSTEADIEVEMGVPQSDADIYLPPGPNADELAEPISLAFPDNTVAEFKDATSIDAYPDTNNDGIQDFPEDFDICEEDADTPEVLDSDLRTEQYRGDPIINLQDVKPGDFGEVTLSFHLCDNPGFVWFFCNNFSEAENGFTEPELDDPDEDGTDEGELAEQMEVRAWYDDGDNIYEPGVQAIDVYHLFDNSGTMEENIAEDGDRDKDVVAADVATQAATALDGFQTTAENTVATMAGEDGTTEELVEDSSNLTDVEDAVQMTTGAAGGNLDAADFVAGLESALADLVTDDTDDESDDNVLIVYTNGDSRPGDQADRDDVIAAADALKQAGVEIKIVALGDLTALQQTFHEELSDELILVPRGPDNATVDASADTAADAVIDNFEDLTGGEQEFFRGTLQEFCDQYEFDPENGSLGFPLDGDVPAPEGGGSADARNCYSASTPHYIGFDWWLPLDHANEIQTDSVQFDLGFYTEQCRHNNGSGQGGGVGQQLNCRPGDGFAKTQPELDGQLSWHARSTIADNDAGTGSARNAELDIRDPSDSDLAEAGASYPSDGTAVQWTLTYSGGTAQLTVDGNSVSTAGPEPTTSAVGITAKARESGASVTVSDIQYNGTSVDCDVSASGSNDTNHVVLEGTEFRDGDTLSGTVAYDANGATGEALGFRVDV